MCVLWKFLSIIFFGKEMITKPGHTIICRTLTTRIQQAGMWKGLYGTCYQWWVRMKTVQPWDFHWLLLVPSEDFSCWFCPKSVALSLADNGSQWREETGKEKNVNIKVFLWSKQGWYTISMYWLGTCSDCSLF